MADPRGHRARTPFAVASVEIAMENGFGIVDEIDREAVLTIEIFAVDLFESLPNGEEIEAAKRLQLAGRVDLHLLAGLGDLRPHHEPRAISGRADDTEPGIEILRAGNLQEPAHRAEDPVEHGIRVFLREPPSGRRRRAGGADGSTPGGAGPERWDRSRRGG